MAGNGKMNVKRDLITSLIRTDIIQDVCDSMSYDEICKLFSKNTSYEKALEILNRRKTFFRNETCVALEREVERIEGAINPLGNQKGRI